jgi:hypothetical protein
MRRRSFRFFSARCGEVGLIGRSRPSRSPLRPCRAVQPADLLLDRTGRGLGGVARGFDDLVLGVEAVVASLSKAPQRVRSAGIGLAAIHLALTNPSKSAQADTAVSRSATSNTLGLDLSAAVALRLVARAAASASLRKTGCDIVLLRWNAVEWIEWPSSGRAGMAGGSAG